MAIRKRPLSKQEQKNKEMDIIEVESETILNVNELRQRLDLSKYLESHKFHFDAVFNETSSNELIYKVLIHPLVQSIFEKTKVIVFAYGQTGSGKTYTMMGDPAEGVKGLYLLASDEIFANLANFPDLAVGVSFYEIYCGKAYDLLNGREQCPIRVDAKENVNVVGLNEKIIPNKDSLMKLIDYGMTFRSSGQTGMNQDSSRSHAILQINLRERSTGKKWSRITFIDLAGSERGADVKDNDKQMRLDGAEINKSLLALKECIRALDQDKKHLPFRGSKLTLILKDSFVGNCKSVMIGNISPSISSSEHTLNTLRYADRVKDLKKGGRKRYESKEEKLASQLMLTRIPKFSQQYEFGVKGEDDHMVFEEYDVRKEDSFLGNRHPPKSEIDRDDDQQMKMENSIQSLEEE